ncbi:hypothetical protein CQW23_25955 [Capsicum baccatum]|uniref:Uncharacterized protein n=1 Tax=Capsicum baccatum TaxID=33114 RepID=A0A2G2VMD9_CAPBA|nr:hypothetical protein CQW23_25955 [Capsicum baccatum]
MDASRAGFLEMRLFGEAKSISGHQTLQLMRRPYGVKGSVYVVTLPTFQRCLKDGPDAAERQPGSRCGAYTLGTASPRVYTGPGVRFFYLTEDDDEDLLTDEDAISQDEKEVFSSSWSGSNEGGEFPNLHEPKEKKVQSTKGSGYQSGSVPRRPQRKKERLKAESLSKIKGEAK